MYTRTTLLALACFVLWIGIVVVNLTILRAHRDDRAAALGVESLLSLDR